MGEEGKEMTALSERVCCWCGELLGTKNLAFREGKIGHAWCVNNAKAIS